MEALRRSKASAGGLPNLPPHSGFLSRRLTARSLVDSARELFSAPRTHRSASRACVHEASSPGRADPSGPAEAREESADVVVYVAEIRLRGHVSGASQAPVVCEIGEYFPRPGQDSPSREEQV